MSGTNQPEPHCDPVDRGATGRRVHLDFLDGLRAICAGVVFLAHVADGGFFRASGQLPPRWVAALLPLTVYDRYAVATFIVLSGYCLMLPVARSADGRLPGGVRGYLRRRARRMLPPYYAALGVSIVVAAILGPVARGDLSLGNIVSHLCLLHNLSPSWRFSLNGPMWTVATEWDIYFLFPLLLLPVWRRSGILAGIGVAFAVGLAPHFALHKWLDPVAPWYFGLFALGAFGALMSFAPDARFRAWKASVPWGPISAGVFMLLLCAFELKPANLPSYPLYLMEPIFALAVVGLLIHCERALATHSERARPLVLRILEAPPIVGVGLWSYSLYLLHAPLLVAAQTMLNSVPMSPAGRLAALWLAGVPIVAALCYALHCAFERPFMAHYARVRSGPEQ